MSAKKVVFKSCNSDGTEALVQCGKCGSYMEESISETVGCPECGQFEHCPEQVIASNAIPKAPQQDPEGAPVGIQIL